MQLAAGGKRENAKPAIEKTMPWHKGVLENY